MSEEIPQMSDGEINMQPLISKLGRKKINIIFAILQCTVCDLSTKIYTQIIHSLYVRFTACKLSIFLKEIN